MFAIKEDDRQLYTNVFRSLDQDGDGFLSGDQARDFLLKSGVDLVTLAHIWETADSDKDGMLSLDEFTTAVHLVSCAKAGIVPEMYGAPSPHPVGVSPVQFAPVAVANPVPVPTIPPPAVVGLKSPRQSLATFIAQLPPEIAKRLAAATNTPQEHFPPTPPTIQLTPQQGMHSIHVEPSPTFAFLPSPSPNSLNPPSQPQPVSLAESGGMADFQRAPAPSNTPSLTFAQAFALSSHPSHTPQPTSLPPSEPVFHHHQSPAVPDTQPFAPPQTYVPPPQQFYPPPPPYQPPVPSPAQYSPPRAMPSPPAVPPRSPPMAPPPAAHPMFWPDGTPVAGSSPPAPLKGLSADQRSSQITNLSPPKMSNDAQGTSAMKGVLGQYGTSSAIWAAPTTGTRSDVTVASTEPPATESYPEPERGDRSPKKRWWAGILSVFMSKKSPPPTVDTRGPVMGVLSVRVKIVDLQGASSGLSPFVRGYMEKRPNDIQRTPTQKPNRRERWTFRGERFVFTVNGSRGDTSVVYLEVVDGPSNEINAVASIAFEKMARELRPKKQVSVPLRSPTTKDGVGSIFVSVRFRWS